MALKEPKNKAKIIPVKSPWIIKKDAMIYTSMKRDTFDKMISKYGLSVYAYSAKKIWYKVSELDEMMESLVIIKKHS